MPARGHRGSQRNSSASESSCCRWALRRWCERVLLFAPAPGGVAAELVDQPARCGGEQPRARVLGDARLRPLPDRGEQSLPGRRPRTHRTSRIGARARRAPPAPTGAGGALYYRISAPPTSRIGRTSIGANRALGHFAAIFDRARVGLAVDDQVAAEVFLGFGEGSVGDHRQPVFGANGFRLHGIGQWFGSRPARPTA